MTEDTGLFGRIEGKSHLYPLSVFYEDTDAGGVVYHANYLNFAERARTAFVRCLGITNKMVAERHNIVIAVRKAEIDYVKAVRLEDLLEVETRLVHLGGASLRMHQTVRMDGDAMCDIRLVLVCMSKDGSGAARMPKELRQMFEPMLSVEPEGN